MITGQKGKQYGLIKPKTSSLAQARAAVFAADDDDDFAGSVVLQHKKSEDAVAKAVAEQDTAVYDYDAWKEADEAKSLVDQRRKAYKPEDVRGSKYIGKLLQKAEERKAERDIVFERKLAKERVAEEAEFGQTEAFVTSAYKVKLEERKRKEEADALKAAEEERNDVTKKGGMADFYRGLLMSNGRFGRVDEPEEETAPPTKAPVEAISSNSGERAHEKSLPVDVVRNAADSREDVREKHVSFDADMPARAIDDAKDIKTTTTTLLAAAAPVHVDPLASKFSAEQIAEAKEAARQRFLDKYGFLPE